MTSNRFIVSSTTSDAVLVTSRIAVVRLTVDIPSLDAMPNAPASPTFAFLDERRRVREALELVPKHEQSPQLVRRYQRLAEEFDRRAAAAWTGGGR